jgi:hypothetical protein
MDTGCGATIFREVVFASGAMASGVSHKKPVLLHFKEILIKSLTFKIVGRAAGEDFGSNPPLAKYQ